MQKKEFDEIKALDIIRESGYSHSAFYNSFTDKYDLADKILRHEILTFEDLIYESISTAESLDPYSGPLPYFVEWFSHVYKHRDLYNLILHNRVPGWGTTEFTKLVYEMTHDWYEIEFENPTLNDLLSRELLDFTTTKRHLAIIEYWDSKNYKYSAEYMAEQATIIDRRMQFANVRVTSSAEKP